MKSHVEAQSYEVRCLQCNCSFAPGTRRCVHCGERLGRGARAAVGGAVHVPAWDEGEEAEAQAPSFVRSALWALSIVIAMLMSAFRVCGS